MRQNSKRSLLFIFITILVDVIGLGVIIPVVPSLIEELTGEGLSQASQYGGWLLFSFLVLAVKRWPESIKINKSKFFHKLQKQK